MGGFNNKKIINGSPDETILEDDASSTISYFGYAAPGTSTSALSWKIKRITSSPFAVEWADGNRNYDNAWTSRASYSYS